MIHAPSPGESAPSPAPDRAHAAPRQEYPGRHPDIGMLAQCFSDLYHRMESTAKAQASLPASIGSRRRRMLRWHHPADRSRAKLEPEDCNRKIGRESAPGSPAALLFQTLARVRALLRAAARPGSWASATAMP